MNNAVEAVLDYPTEDMLTRICEANWNGGKGDGIVFYDICRHDAINCTMSGRITDAGIEYGFIIHDGNWNGTEVAEWGLAEDVGTYEPPYREPATFVPENDALSRDRPAMFKVYGMWRKEAWFQEMERSYNYDRHFQPGTKIESHYREKAAKRGLKVGRLSNFSDEQLAMIGEIRPRASDD